MHQGNKDEGKLGKQLAKQPERMVKRKILKKLGHRVKVNGGSTKLIQNCRHLFSIGGSITQF
jgi:hypothetical protein